MSLTTSKSMQLDSFHISLQPITGVAVDALHALSLSVGWPHRAEDWQFLLSIGKGVVAVDGIDRALGSAMWFPQSDHFATIGMVITSPRLQTNGAGKWLMQQAFADLEGYALGLNATRAAKRLYRSLDFLPEATVYQCQGEARPSDLSDIEDRDAEARPLAVGELHAAQMLDRDAYGCDRSSQIEALYRQSKTIGLFRRGALEAFAFCRPFGRGHVVGPVVAACDRDAILVTHPHVVAHSGHFLRLDTRQRSGAFIDFVTGSGLPVFDTVTTMSLHQPWMGKNASAKMHTYALAAQAIG